jgi:hypothetical protein
MSERNPKEMSQARFIAIIDAYGGNPGRWPQEERERAKHWLDSNPQAQARTLEASSLDGIIVLPATAISSSALECRLLDDFDRAKNRWSVRTLVRSASEAVWPGAPVWQPACALGLAFAAGLCFAAFAPFDIAQRDDGSGSVFALDGVQDVDSGHGI